MKAAIDPKQAAVWFGANPPDLTLVARSRAAAGQGTGADYLYTYLRSYYRDDTKPTGWNNLVFPNVGMPHVLWQMQGERRPVYVEREEHGHNVQIQTGWEQVTPGTMSTAEFDRSVGDLVNYMQWMSEPPRTHACASAWACAVPAALHRDCLAPQRLVLERRQVRDATTRPGHPGYAYLQSGQPSCSHSF